MNGPAGAATDAIPLKSAAGRWLLAASTIGSGMAFLDSTVVGVALPRIGRELRVDLSALQWTVSGYLLTMSALIMLSGSLGDQYGRRRVFVIGVLWFSLASALCAIAPNAPLLVLARLLQGVGGALLTPGSLALIEAEIAPLDRARAIGLWSGLAGVSGAVGPFLGGWLVDVGGWRWVFAINLPLGAVTAWVATTRVAESHGRAAPHRPDLLGAGLAATGLAALTFALIRAGDRGVSGTLVVVGLLGVVALMAFVVLERRIAHPMVPMGVFANRQFTGANLATVGVYAGLGVMSLLLVVDLQQVLGYSALQAGVSSLPVTILMLLLSSASGQLSTRTGPRLPMTAGPLIMALGFVLLSRVDASSAYLSGVLPGVLVLGVGLTATVAPLTATALGALDVEQAGVASGVNNTVARTAQMLAVAVVPVVAGLGGTAYQHPDRFQPGFERGMLIAAVLCGVGALAAFAMIRRPQPEPGAAEPLTAQA